MWRLLAALVAALQVAVCMAAVRAWGRVACEVLALRRWVHRGACRSRLRAADDDAMGITVAPSGLRACSVVAIGAEPTAHRLEVACSCHHLPLAQHPRCAARHGRCFDLSRLAP